MPAITQYYEINADEPERVVNVSHKKNHASNNPHTIRNNMLYLFRFIE